MRLLMIGLSCTLILQPGKTSAEPFVFTRIGQSSGLEAGNVGAAYSIETKSDLHVHVKQEVGGHLLFGGLAGGAASWVIHSFSRREEGCHAG